MELVLNCAHLVNVNHRFERELSLLPVLLAAFLFDDGFQVGIFVGWKRECLGSHRAHLEGHRRQPARCGSTEKDEISVPGYALVETGGVHLFRGYTYTGGYTWLLVR